MIPTSGLRHQCISLRPPVGPLPIKIARPCHVTDPGTPSARKSMPSTSPPLRHPLPSYSSCTSPLFTGSEAQQGPQPPVAPVGADAFCWPYHMVSEKVVKTTVPSAVRVESTHGRSRVQALTVSAQGEGWEITYKCAFHLVLYSRWPYSVRPQTPNPYYSLAMSSLLYVKEF